MDDIEKFYPTEEEIALDKQYSNFSKNTTDGMILNSGNTLVNYNFDNYLSHIDMCYEYSNCRILEPTIADDGNWDVLICVEEE